MPGSQTSDNWLMVNGDDGASDGGALISEIITSSAPGAVTSTSNSPEVETTIPLITSSAEISDDSEDNDSITSSQLDLLEESEQIEILAMTRTQRRAEYSAARAERGSVHGAVPTRGRDSSIDRVDAEYVVASGSTNSLVSAFKTLGITAQPVAGNPNHTNARPKAALPAAPPSDPVFARELAAYLRSKTEGTPEIRGLRGWQVLAKAGGVTVISNSIPEIRRAIKTKFVNIYDVLRALESDGVATGFTHAGQLALYTFHNGKTMVKSQAKVKQMLKVFLKELS